jgi:hypothetical protein
MNPKNQHQQVLWYLYNWDEFSLKDVINDSMFYKFQTRLSDIENEHLISISTRKKEKFTNRFGRKSKYNIYKRCVSKEKILELFEKFK